MNGGEQGAGGDDFERAEDEGRRGVRGRTGLAYAVCNGACVDCGSRGNKGEYCTLEVHDEG